MITQELWAEIPEFPNYQISSFGEIYNTRTNSIMRPSLNNHGHLRISLLDENGDRRSKTIASMVAELFVESPDEMFDQVIVLDGDFTNVRADNLAWRPTWFAWKYTRQFKRPAPVYYTNLHVVDVVHGKEYDCVISAGVAQGLLFDDVWLSTYTSNKVYPTGSIFEVRERV